MGVWLKIFGSLSIKSRNLATPVFLTIANGPGVTEWPFMIRNLRKVGPLKGECRLINYLECIHDIHSQKGMEKILD